MNEDVEKKLLEISDSLGVGLKTLWEILVKQAYIEGIYYSSVTLIFILLGVLVTRWVLKTDYSKEVADPELFSPHTFSRIVLSVLWAVLCMLFFRCFGIALYCLLNPEFVAVDKILEKLK